MTDPFALLGIAGALAIGACVGSFLNVCIYRWPRGLKVNQPARSFCPGCQRPIPLRQNLPVLSWLLLGGRCAGCKGRIPVRYLVVEVLTALAFLAVWLAFPPGPAVAYAFLAAVCIVTIFVDFEHYIIPDQTTWGALPIGILASTLWPSLQGESLWWHGLALSLLGAVAGFVLLWLVVEGGKKLFGRKTRAYPTPTPWELVETEAGPELRIAGESMPWDDLFSRESDRLRVEGGAFRIDGHPAAGDTVVFAWNRFELHRGGEKLRETQLAEIKSMTGTAVRLVIPREAMGFGDVKFLAMAGAFIGWQGILFTLFAASLLGSVFGVASLLVGRRNWMGRIPFGPWLVAGLWLWIATGRAVFDWYLGLAGFHNGPDF
jgi:leader peptidase (prepilin peptidase) / N-methyltransferase